MRNSRTALLSLIAALIFIPSLVYASSNAGDFAGSVAIGTGYANTITGPTNGMIVQGIVGIGTSSPAYPLHIIGSGSNVIDMYVTDQTGANIVFSSNSAGGGGSAGVAVQTGTGAGSSAGAYYAARGKMEAAITFVAANNTSGQRAMGFRVGGNGCTNCFVIQSLNDTETVINSTPFQLANNAPSYSLTINSGGHIGIGTLSPQSQLHVYGGEVQVGSSGASCASTNNGAIRYSSGAISYCTGTTWTTVAGASLPSLTSANIWVGNGSNVATAVVMSGDCTISNAGAITCTKTNGTAFGSLATQSSVNLATQTTGSLPSGNLPALTSTDIWVGNGSNVATAVALSGDCTISNAGAITCTKTNGVSFGTLATASSVNLATQTTGSLPSASLPALTSTDIWVGNGSNVATAVAMSGDCTLSNAGAITCTKTNGTSFGTLATQFGVNLSSQATGTLQAGQFPALTGDVTTTAGSLATTVAAIQGTTVSGTTGTGNVVFSASPTLTGTVTGAASNWSGSVGIGTTSPVGSLNIYNGTTFITTDASSGDQIYIQGKTNPLKQLVIGFNTTSNYGSLQANLAGTGPEPLILNGGGGNVGIGTTAPQSLLNLYGGDAMISGGGNILAGVSAQITSPSARIVLEGNGTEYTLVSRQNISTATNQFLFMNASGVVGGIATGVSSTSFNTTSDKRLKENVKPVSNSGTLIDAMQPVTFDWVDVPAHPSGMGMLAQDLYKVLPDAVFPGDSDDKLNQRSAPGFRPWAVDYSKLVPVAVAEIKSLRARAEADEKRLADDEATIAAMKAKLGM
jgi:hypothetical protein